MPFVITVTVSSASYDEDTPKVTIGGSNFAENRYGGKAQYRVDSGAWNDMSGSYAWSDDEIVVTLAAPFPDGGVYDVRVLSGDNVWSDPLNSAFEIAAGELFFFFEPQLKG